MDSVNLSVLKTLQEWKTGEQPLWLVTVVEIFQSNFQDYAPLRFSECRKSRYILWAAVNRPLASASLARRRSLRRANALFNLTGKRIRCIPFEHETLV